MFFYHNLACVFAKKTRPLSPDNQHPTYSHVFTAKEMDEIRKTASPYIGGSGIKHPLFRAYDNGLGEMRLVRTGERNVTVMNVLKYTHHDAPTTHNINFGIGYAPSSTLNFSEMMRQCRLHLDRVLIPEPKQQSLALT